MLTFSTGHRRRTTTTTQSTVTYTTVEGEEATDPYTTIETSTHPKLPKPLRLSSSMLDKDYDVHIDKNAIDDEISEIERYKHQEKYTELDEASLSKSLSKVKKMYRDSAGSTANKLSGKVGKTGIFLTDNCTTVIAQIGTTAILHCEVSDITENTVSYKYVRNICFEMLLRLLAPKC